ncbi:uncharacterized protein LOC142240924 [Haematobia irritans]|uniref:uncharacterized protein LOC142240924 n=1 Tax=Haematobia irritans TaxID=7368 RepID=UPI003F4FAECD
MCGFTSEDRDFNICPMESRRKHKPTQKLSSSKSSKPLESLGRQRALIKDYMESLQLPPWYREISTFQKNAADRLADSIRDDIDQKISSHTLHCLKCLGLEPLPSNGQLLTLLALCGGSDVAFLWFLKDWLYGENDPVINTPQKYSINEQILMSCIAHLDMSTTLRELDRILPLPNRKRENFVENPKEYKTKSKRKTSSHSYAGPFAPYFEKLRTAVQYRSKYTIPEPGRKANVGLQEDYYTYQDVKFSPEGLRWFKDFKTKLDIDSGKGKPESSDISQLLDNFEAAKIEETMVHKLSQQFDDIEHLRRSFDTEMDKIFIENSKKLDSGSPNRFSCRFIIQRLKYDIEKYRKEFRQMVEDFRKHCTFQMLSYGLSGKTNLKTILKSSKTETPLTTLISCDQSRGDNNQTHRPTPSCGCLVANNVKGQDHNWNSTISLPEMNMRWQHNEGPHLQENTNQVDHQHRPENCGCLIGQGDSCSQHCLCCRQSSSSNLGKFREKYFSQSSIQNEGQFSLSPEKYFQAPTLDHQYRFDYQKIFSLRENNPQNINLKKAFIEAIDSDIALLNKLQKEEYLQHQPRKKLNEAIKKCYQKLIDQTEKTLETPLSDSSRTTDGRLNYNLEYYDPNDDGLMDRLLKDALDRMSKDTLFVIPCMPMSHRLPLLREWIRLRYGKIYSRTHLDKLCEKDQLIFRSLADVGISIKMPQSKDLGSNSTVDYSCRDYLVKKSKVLRQQCYKNINKAMLDQSHIVCCAMRPFLCANGPPTNTIFAYMPARSQEIYNLRPWKSEEYRDNRLLAVGRLRQIQAERHSLYL